MRQTAPSSGRFLLMLGISTLSQIFPKVGAFQS